MTLSLLPAPNVAAISAGGASIGFIEPLGFSADNRQLLVHVSFTDDGDPGSGLHHGVWLYDLAQQAYTVCLNSVIAGTGAASGVDVKSAVISGSGSSLRVVAYEDGFVQAPERFVQRIAAVRETASASPPRWRLD